jgi:small subunit ribosomal protein S16
MLIIRLQRTGKKNQADFRIVLAEKEAPVNKKIIEVLGSYNPRKKNFQVKEERLKYWLGQKVSLSETVQNLLVTKSLFDGKKVKAFTIPKKPVEAVVDKPADTSAPVVEIPVVAEAMEGRPAESVAEKPADAQASAVETPVEVAEATAEVESKVEAAPAEIPAVEESAPVPETTTPEQPAA